jgi:GNAT superfamily N-acetyltransferase
VTGISVRVAGADDIPALAWLRRAWTDEGGAVTDDPGFEERFADWCAAEAGRRLIWVAEADGALVGMVNLAVFERMPRPGVADSRWGYLANAFVLAGYRDRGVGRLLVDALLDHARATGLVRVVLSPTERSVPFYERAGFGPADMLLAQVPLEPDRQ